MSGGIEGRRELAGVVESFGAESAMRKIKPTRRAPLQPLETGQVWQMPEMNLQVGMIGKFLVHYKLGKPNAVRIPNSCSSRTMVEKYLKTNKAVLVKA